MWFSGETPEQLESCEVRGPRVKGGRLEDGEAATLPETNIFRTQKKNSWTFGDSEIGNPSFFRCEMLVLGKVNIRKKEMMRVASKWALEMIEVR